LYRSFSLFNISLGRLGLFDNILKYVHFVDVPREGLEKFENLENVADLLNPDAIVALSSYY
jgi:hypothetical protein